ncbi:MAG: hypothetical protein R3232_03615 [Clostridia bacterium]|nr:hypothetical protein [Clostridia bacterium]
MQKSAEDIKKKHAEEERLQAMAKRMAREEQKRRDINVEHWDGIQSNKAYRLSFAGKRWADRGTGGKIFFIMGAIVFVAVVGILVFTAVKAFTM